MKSVRIASLIAIVLLLVGCTGSPVGIGGGDPVPPIADPEPEPPKPEPANVIVTDGSVRLMAHERVTLTLENTGGPGTFYVEFWGPTFNVPNPPPTFWGQTESYTIPAGWSETAAWDVPTEMSSVSRVRWVIVYTRDEGSIQYRETSRYDLPVVRIGD